MQFSEFIYSDNNEEENESNDYQENESDLEMQDNTDNSDDAESIPRSSDAIGGLAGGLGVVHRKKEEGLGVVMQQILKTNKPKRKKTVVLAKAKRLCDVKVKEKQEDTVHTKPKIKEKSLGIRVKPSITDREHERMLQKVATKGVVQLFNAVKQQQTDINKKLSQAGPLERKREQVLKSIDKNAFLDILMGNSKSIPVDDAAKSEKLVKQTDNKDKDDKIWSVLRDDFVMGAKLKDWDKKNIEEEDSSAPEDMDSDED